MLPKRKRNCKRVACGIWHWGECSAGGNARPGGECGAGSGMPGRQLRLHAASHAPHAADARKGQPIPPRPPPRRLQCKVGGNARSGEMRCRGECGAGSGMPGRQLRLHAASHAPHAADARKGQPIPPRAPPRRLQCPPGKQHSPGASGRRNAHENACGKNAARKKPNSALPPSAGRCSRMRTETLGTAVRSCRFCFVLDRNRACYPAQAGLQARIGIWQPAECGPGEMRGRE